MFACSGRRSILSLTSIRNVVILSKFCPHRLAWSGRVLLRHVTGVQIPLGVFPSTVPPAGMKWSVGVEGIYFFR